MFCYRITYQNQYIASQVYEEHMLSLLPSPSRRLQARRPMHVARPRHFKPQAALVPWPTRISAATARDDALHAPSAVAHQEPLPFRQLHVQTHSRRPGPSFLWPLRLPRPLHSDNDFSFRPDSTDGCEHGPSPVLRPPESVARTLYSAERPPPPQQQLTLASIDSDTVITRHHASPRVILTKDKLSDPRLRSRDSLDSPSLQKEINTPSFRLERQTSQSSYLPLIVWLPTDRVAPSAPQNPRATSYDTTRYPRERRTVRPHARHRRSSFARISPRPIKTNVPLHAEHRVPRTVKHARHRAKDFSHPREPVSSVQSVRKSLCSQFSIAGSLDRSPGSQSHKSDTGPKPPSGASSGHVCTHQQPSAFLALKTIAPLPRTISFPVSSLIFDLY